MIVMKFGGTSVEDAASIEQVTQIIRDQLPLRPVVVVSAMGNVTQKLLQAATAIEAGDGRRASEIIADLNTMHRRAARQLLSDSKGAWALDHLESELAALDRLIRHLVGLDKISPRLLDSMLAYGELLSSAILAGAMCERNIPSCLMDSRRFIRTNNNYGAASPLFQITNSSIVEQLAPEVKRGAVPVVQGFIGSTLEGATTTLGRGGSDYTATIVGAALGTSDIQFWKDVFGLMTCDPAIFNGARTVKVCTFTEAAQLTHFGAKLLHPKAVQPAAEKNIPIHIYNSKRPWTTGTAITTTAPRSNNPVKSIAFTRPVTLVKAAANSMNGSHAASPKHLLSKLLDGLQGYSLSPFFSTVTSSSVAIAVDSKAFSKVDEQTFLADASKYGEVWTENSRALVSLVGQDIRNNSPVMGRVSEVVAAGDPDALSVHSSPISMNFVVADRHANQIVANLHELLFERIDSKIFE